MSPAEQSSVVTSDRDQITAYLSILFEPKDFVTFRPIETWTEGNKKRSRVLYDEVCSIPQQAWINNGLMLERVANLEAERGNAFIGVCPRQSGAGTHELAWQIQTVRCLWVDVDGCTVNEARARMEAAELPEPTIIVSSGNGGHFYWLLTEPMITGAPSSGVFVDWTEIKGKRKPIKFIVIDDEKVWLEDPETGKAIPSNHPKLTDTAQRVQDTCQGIAAAIGGDHTQDLSRLLRLPGTMNRKNGRNGADPKPCILVSADPKLRYPFESFARFADQAPAKKKREIVATIPLPVTRRLTPAKADSLNEKVFSCGTAADRSSADFHLCCWAIENGVSKDEVWEKCQQVGKFAERGESYFESTWSSAEEQTRSTIYDKLQGHNSPAERRTVSSATDSGECWSSTDAGPDDDETGCGRPTIYVDPVHLPVANTLAHVTKHLLSVGNCFIRVDQLVVIQDGAIRTVLSAKELAGLLSEHVEFYFVDEESGAFTPLPASYANTWLNNFEQRCSLPAIKLFTRNPVYTEDWRLLAPGFDEASGIYYAGPAVEPRHDTTHLDALLRDFCFKTPGDRTNYLGMLLTTLLIPRFIGSKPAVLFNGNQPELGKSILAQIIAVLRDGQPVETASYNPNDEEFEKRLGSIVRRGATTIIIDNAKGRARNQRIESACLERSITDPILSYRLLGYSQDIRAENSHIFCLTANSPDVSRDLVTRSVVVNLYHEGNPERRTFSITDPEGYAQEHRLELLGELIGMVERWKASGMPQANVHSRFNKRGWGTFIGGILHENGEPDFLANAAEAATQLDDTRREFSDLIATLADHPQGIWTAGELVDHCGKHELLQEELGDGSPRSKATRLGVIAGRYVAERFDLADGRTATFLRSEDRNGKVYRVGITEDLRNV